MSIKAVLSEKGDIPKGLEAFYTEADGKFVLQVEGMKTQEDFDNYAEALKKRFTDAGSDFARRNGSPLSREDVLDVVEGALKKFGDSASTGGDKSNGKGGNGQDGDVTARLHDLERDVASLTEANTKLQGERDAALKDSRGTTIRNALSTAAQKAKASPEGIDNLVTLIEPNFEVAQDGTVVTKLEAKGGVSPNQKPDDFFSQAARDAQYRMFWPASKGAGADHDLGGPGGGGDLTAENPWSKAGWNLTNQGKMFTSNKAEAERLMQAAGVKLGAVTAVR